MGSQAHRTTGYVADRAIARFHPQKSLAKWQGLENNAIKQMAQMIYFIIMARSTNPAIVPTTPSTPSIAKVSPIISLLPSTSISLRSPTSRLDILPLSRSSRLTILLLSRSSIADKSLRNPVSTADKSLRSSSILCSVLLSSSLAVRALTPSIVLAWLIKTISCELRTQVQLSPALVLVGF